MHGCEETDINIIILSRLTYQLVQQRAHVFLDKAVFPLTTFLLVFNFHFAMEIIKQKVTST
jgi:hypothetical protein